MTKANLPSGLLGKVLKRGTRVLRLAQAKVCFCYSSLRKSLKKIERSRNKKNTTRSYIFFKGKVNRQVVLHDKFKNNSSRSCRPRLPFHKSTELLLNRIFFAHLKVSTGSFLRGFHTQSACHLEQLILKYLNLFYQYHLPRTFSLAYSGRLFV